MAHGDGFSARSVGVAVKLEVHEEGRAGAAVRYQVAHESVDEIRVGLHGYSSPYYSSEFVQSPLRALISGSAAGILGLYDQTNQVPRLPRGRSGEGAAVLHAERRARYSAAPGFHREAAVDRALFSRGR